MKILKGMVLMFGAVIDTATMGLFAWTFYSAVRNGGQITIYVNQRGEMMIEFVLIPLALISAIVADVYFIKDLYSSSKYFVKNLVRRVFNA